MRAMWCWVGLIAVVSISPMLLAASGGSGAPVDPNSAQVTTAAGSAMEEIIQIAKCKKSSPVVPNEIKAYVTDPLCCSETQDDKRYECLKSSIKTIRMLNTVISKALGNVLLNVSQMASQQASDNSGACGMAPNAPYMYGNVLIDVEDIPTQIEVITTALQNWSVNKYLDAIQASVNFIGGCTSAVKTACNDQCAFGYGQLSQKYTQLSQKYDALEKNCNKSWFRKW